MSVKHVHVWIVLRSVCKRIRKNDFTCKTILNFNATVQQRNTMNTPTKNLKRKIPSNCTTLTAMLKTGRQLMQKSKPMHNTNTLYQSRYKTISYRNVGEFRQKNFFFFTRIQISWKKYRKTNSTATKKNQKRCEGNE